MDWIQTYSGNQFWPLIPAGRIEIEDIAAALSKLCRFGGHCTRFYSVAEHSIHVAWAVPPEHQLTALLHDASEAYLSDIVAPVKRQLVGYAEAEERVSRAIAGRFGTGYPFDRCITLADRAILTDERAQCMAPMAVSRDDWGDTAQSLGVNLQFWLPARAEREFIESFRRYGGGRDRL